MTTKRLVVLLFACAVLYVLTEIFLLDSLYKTPIDILLFIAVCVFCILSGKHAFTVRKHRDATNQKVEVVQNVHYESLTKGEVTFLKSKRNRKVAGISFAFLLWFGIYLLAANFFLPALLGQAGVYIFWVLSALIFGVTIYFITRHTLKLNEDIRQGQKLVIVGNLSHWERYGYNEDDYVFYVNDIAFQVKPAVFEKYAKGDAMEAHLFEPWKNMLLFDRKLGES